jgi:hypothetical protein
MQKCWQYLPEDRPNFDELVAELQKIVLTGPGEPEYVCFDVASSTAYADGDSAMGQSRSDTSLEETIIEMGNLY